MVKVKITDMDFQGRGVARVDNIVTFVDNALKDEIVEIKIEKENKKFKEAKVIKIENESQNRITPQCPYYLKCGGCDLMHINYNAQLKFKEDKVKYTLKKFARIDPLIKPIIKADEIFNYRNKITFHINNDIGFFKKKTNDFVSVDKCLICNKSINDLIDKLKKLDLKNIKQIIVRSSMTTLERMIIIECNKDIDTTAINKIDSVYLKIGNKYILKSGSKNIIEKMNDFNFYISPSSFFQVNTFQAIKLYEKVKECASLTNKENVLDLYCGTGTISIFLAKNAKKVYGIEINEEAIMDANYNKEINNIKNVEFYAMNANQFLDKIKEKIDVLIVDPPRGGLDKKTVDSIIKLNPLKVVYVSCDVATLARDLNILKEKYDVLEITPVDMFPNTCHVESVCILTRKNL